MAKIAVNRIKGLTPLLDRKQIQEVFALDGENFYIDAEGPISGFSRKTIFNIALSDNTDVQTFRVNAGTEVFVFAPGVVLKYNEAAQQLIPVFTFTNPSESFPWSHAEVNGIDYFAKKGVGLLQYTASTEVWLQISGGDVPASIQACAQSGGRLIVAATGLIAWSEIDDGTAFTPSTVTGAGFQSLSIIGATSADAILALKTVFDGFLTFTTGGLLRSELINSINPFRHRPLSEEHIPISPWAIESVAELREHVFLGTPGFFRTAGKIPEPFEPLMGEYFHKKVLPFFDLAVPNLFRLSFNFDRQWFFVSISENSVPGQYTKSYMLYLPSGQWGIFNRSLGGFVELDTSIEIGSGFSFGYSCDRGSIHRFTDSSLHLLWPTKDASSVEFRQLVEYPGRRELTTTKMPSRLRLSTYNEANFSVSGVYNTDFVFVRVRSPEDLTAASSTSEAGTPAKMRTNMQFGAALAQILIKLESATQAALDAKVEIGLFALGENQNADEMSLITEVEIGQLDAGGFQDLDEDWLLDFPTDFFEDWLTASGDEDWGEGAASTTEYTADIIGTNDGYAVLGADVSPPNPMEEVLSQVRQDGRMRFHSCNNNGLFHYLRVNALNINDSFHVKTIDMRGVPSGKVV